MEFKTLYKWSKRTNENRTVYEIYDVPILTVSKTNNKDSSVDEKRLQKLLQTFNEDKGNGFYPRSFLGHHNDFKEDRSPVGFVDALKLSSGTLYATLCEIPESIFFDIKDLHRFLYRSAEIVGDRLTGVALLDTVPPFFQFPLLALERDGDVLPITFSVRSCFMDEKDEKKPVDEPIEKKSVDESTTEPTETFGAKEMNELKQLLKSVLETLKSHVTKEESRWADPSTSSVAYSAPKTSQTIIAQSPIEKELQTLREELETFKVRDKILRLGTSAEHIRFLEDNVSKFSTAKDKMAFLDVIAEKSEAFSQPFTPAAKKGQEGQTLAREEASVAREAEKMYEATMQSFKTSGESPEAFTMLWPSKEGFVSYAIEESKKDPGFLKRLVI